MTKKGVPGNRYTTMSLVKGGAGDVSGDGDGLFGGLSGIFSLESLVAWVETMIAAKSPTALVYAHERMAEQLT